ncbi:TonB-dependent receptor [Sulfuricurvum sp.]|uniref:TonB-dependent receptor plug domain-containing protein n=1 Tax=Sulfuricurvum sp. TaxID=2025608 RepID=UPI00260BCF3E|nr:TonB-dependent receptor [Sulfuricurvum sp.]MDD2781441.1 TonB-dependent receptor [Sulfuricurvum sp.]
MFRKIVWLSVPVTMLANPFNATLEDEVSWLKDETFVISASKVQESIKKTSASVTIIDEDMIDKMGANTLLDVLRVVPGLGVSQSNVYVDKISVRGIETWFSEKVLILLDGHSLNSDLLNGGASNTYANFPVEQIKRVEIIRGPASALYGENAFTALINIITKEAQDVNGVQISTKVGSYNTAIANLLVGKTYENFDIAANINYRDSDGYSAYVANDAIGNSGHTSPTSKRLNTNLSLKHNNGFYLKANYNNTEDGPRYGIAHALNNEDKAKREAYFIELGHQYKINDNYTLDSRVYHDSFIADNRWEIYPEGFPTGAYTDGMLAISGYTNKKSGIETLLTVKKENYTVVSGLSYETQRLKDPIYKANYIPSSGAPLGALQDFSDPSTNFVSEANRKFWAAYSELLYDPREDLRLTVGIRYDHYNDFGGVFNPRLGAAWEVNEHNTLKLMYGEAFRAPTFAELYNKNNPALVGNPDLNPETVQTFEMSLHNNSIENLEASLNLFHSTIDDIISVLGTTYTNRGTMTTRGIEAELKQHLHRGSYITANYTYQQPKNDDTRKIAENISRHEGYVALNYRINTVFNLYTDAKYIGKQTRSTADTRVPVESSITSNATLLAKDLFLKDVQMKFSIYNLFDEKSYDSNAPYDYPQAGRSYMAELSYKF